MRRRVFVGDARENGVYLRATWHPDGGQFVVSTWNDEVCTGAVRVRAADAAPLIGLLADGLADAAARPAVEVSPVEPAHATGRFDRLRAWLRRKLPRPVSAPTGRVSLRAVDDADPTTRRSA